MQPADLFAGASRVRDAVIACELLRRFSELTAAKWQNRPDPAGLMNCYGMFAAELKDFGAPERSIMHALDLDMLSDAAWWTRLVLAAAEPQPLPAMLVEIAAVSSRISFMVSTLPKLMGALAAPASEPYDGPPTLSLRLARQADQVSQPRLLARAIEAISILWEVVGELIGDPAPLTLVSCSPEASATLVFQGAASIMTPLKSMLVTLWEQVVAHHAMTPAERLEQIPSSLPILDALETSGLERAAELQSKVVEGLRLFLLLGASIPEMDDPARFTPARLLHSPAGSLYDTLVVTVGERTDLKGLSAPASARQADIDAVIAEERDFLQRESERKRTTDRAPRSWVSKRPPEE